MMKTKTCHCVNGVIPRGTTGPHEHKPQVACPPKPRPKPKPESVKLPPDWSGWGCN